MSHLTAVIDAIKREERHDPVNKPLHYTEGAIECIDAIEAAVCQLRGEEAFLTGQVLKYLWRWRSKNGIEDLQKAKWYLERLIAHALQNDAASIGPGYEIVRQK